MTHQSANSHSDPAILVHTNASPDNRCHHQFVNGTRCRLLTLDPDSPFCSRQAAQSDAQVIIDTDLSAAFGDEPTDFRSAAHINDFLAKLTTLLIQNRISSRRASVLAYISGLELRTLAAIEHELGQDDFCPLILGDENPASAAATADKRS